MKYLITRARARCASLFGGETLAYRALLLSTLTLSAIGAVACTAEVTTRPAVVAADEDVIVAPAPVNVYAYPHTVYRGDAVYLVDGRWYQRRGSHWVYYRHEPDELVRHRHYVQAAPPARHYPPPPGEAIRVR